MKILQLATSLTNGAGKAARRINEAANLYGIDSTLVTSGRVDGILSDKELRISPSKDKRIMSKSLTYFQEKALNASNFPMTPMSIQSLDIAQLDLKKYDFVNLHATYNLLSFHSMKYLTEKCKNVIITLHDERPYTGGCHNTMTCIEYQKECKQCPASTMLGKKVVEISYKLERKYIQNSARRISILAPSNWIKHQAELSNKFTKLSITKISNPIPENIYFSSETSSLLFLDSTKFNLGFMSANLENPFKGLEMLMQALELLDADERNTYRLILIGNKSKSLDSPLETHYFQVSEDKEVARLIKNIDLLIVPSKGDNSPSVISESLMCGTKVIGSNRGGIPEMLGYDENLIFDFNSPSSILKKIRENTQRYRRDEISENARNIYSYSSFGTKYSEFLQQFNF